VKITFDRDRYGAAARSTLIADYVEACAWKYGRYQLDDMESLLRRLGRTRARDAFTRGGLERFDDEVEEFGAEAPIGPSAADDLEEESDEGQRYVIRLLKERQAALGTKYPFQVDDVAVTWPQNSETAYDSLLAITLAHSFHIVISPALTTGTVEVLFEHVTARCLQRDAWKVHNMGDGGRHSASFSAAVDAASQALDWQMKADATPYKHQAQEEGCDTLIMLPWLDRRPGRLFLIGQSAVTTSESWRAKIAEASPGAWGPRLQRHGQPAPVPFLAVSHHVEDGTLRDLQIRAEGIVIDRLRLVCGEKSDELTADEKRVIASVRAAPIEI
jgi:hypothetical protein